MSSCSIITRPKPKKSIPCWDSYQHPLTHMCVTVFACKWCLICAYSSPDWAKMTYFHWRKQYCEQRSHKQQSKKKKKNMLMMDLFLTEMSLTSQDVNWWTGVLWIACGSLWFWTLILTAPIHCRWSTGEQVMLCFSKSDDETNSSTVHPGWPQ